MTVSKITNLLTNYKVISNITYAAVSITNIDFITTITLIILAQKLSIKYY